MDLQLTLCVAVLGFTAVEAGTIPQCRLNCPYGLLPEVPCVCREFAVPLCNMTTCPADTGCVVDDDEAVCLLEGFFFSVDIPVTTDAFQPNDVCEQPLERGFCQGNDPKYFYNSESGRCEKFLYSGCFGNENNFDTYEECSLRCERS